MHEVMSVTFLCYFILCISILLFLKELIALNYMKRVYQRHTLCIRSTDGIILAQHCSCTPELKLAAVFVYVVILFGASVVQNVLETYRTYGYVDDYFLCESLGTNVCTLDPDHFNGAINAFDIFSTLVFSLSPYMSLVYIMPVHLMRQKVKRWRSKSTVVTA